MHDTIEAYRAPTSLAEAAEILRGGPVTILAGGTDLMPQTQAGRVKFARVLMNIRRIPELAGITVEDGALRIGALVTVTELMADPAVRAHAPILATAGDHFASAQLRNAATIGGNVCNASPAGDLLLPLLALEAEVELVSKPDGRCVPRRLPLRDFFTGPGRTVRAANELLAAVRVPLTDAPRVMRFVKFGTRPALDISAVAIALAAVPRGGALHDVRVAFGAVAPTPLRGSATEAALEGRALTSEVIARAAEAAAQEVRPISDVRASAWYRRELVRNLMKRVLDDVAAS
jgi:CO/xanthine dehydrogenase FAD-binding subunit